MNTTEDASKLLDQLIESVDQAKPKEAHEVGLIDQFIALHAGVYQLESEKYETLLHKLLMNRINNAAW